MKSIWKWNLLVTDLQVIDVPVGTKFLTAQNQGGHLTLWGTVNQTNDLEPRTIAIYGTGNPVPDDPGTYIATVQQGPFVWHAFEVDRK
jgi:hypothetical protein